LGVKFSTKLLKEFVLIAQTKNKSYLLKKLLLSFC